MSPPPVLSYKHNLNPGPEGRGQEGERGRALPTLRPRQLHPADRGAAQVTRIPCSTSIYGVFSYTS